MILTQKQSKHVIASQLKWMQEEFKVKEMKLLKVN